MAENFKQNREIEALIWRLHKQGAEPTTIADELLKLWEKNFLSLTAKMAVGRFCLLNGFLVSLCQALRKDLAKTVPICWPLVFQCAVNFEKTFLDAFLVGASSDHLLMELAQSALEKGNPDPRWIKILNEGLNDRRKSLLALRSDLMQKMKIFEREGMKAEAAQISQHLNLIFSDPEVKAATRKYEDWALSQKLSQLRHRLHATVTEPKPEVFVPPAEFVDAVRAEFSRLDLVGAREFAVGLKEMGLFDLAIEVLATRKDQWGPHERLLEIEILVECGKHVEALDRCQQLISKHLSDPDVVEACLYYSAKCYYALSDVAQAVGILKGLHDQKPGFRDVESLLRIWEDKL